MRAQLVRVLVVLTCLVFGAVGVSSRAAAADKKKSWPSKKHHHKTHHRSGRSAKPSSKSAAPGTSAAPAEETDDDDSDESAEQDDKQTDDSKAKPSKTKGKGARDDEASDDKGKGKGKGDDDDEEEDGSDAGVLHRKARKPSVAEEGGAAPAAVELAVGPRIIHRSFSFNDPLSNYNPSAAKPYSYVLPGGPAPFVTLGLYPAAFATRGFASNIGLVASYEKLLGTKTMAADGSTFTTFAQQFEVGARVRVPLGGNEVGVSGTYGKQAFHVSESDPGPGAGSSVPNVDYTFAAATLDGRLRVGPVELGAHVGSRFVFNTGSLAQNWFPTTKTTSIDAGVSLAYQVSPLVGVIVGGDFLRYGFNFNPVPMNNALVAAGAVDQYISGFAALRLTIAGG